MVETITLNTDPEQYTGSVQGKYENYASDRYTFLARAREAARASKMKALHHRVTKATGAF